MDPRPNLIAPVIIVACALILVGGIGTALSSSEDTGETASPGARLEDRTMDLATVTTPAPTGTGAGGAANETASDANTTLPSPTATATVTGSGQGSASQSLPPCPRTAGYP